MSTLLLIAVAAFALGVFVIHRMRKNLAAEAELAPPPGVDGLPVHTYHAVIQQLKQQKHELAAQQLVDRRKAKVSDTLSSTVLANLSCGVLFFNTGGLVRQANSAARKLLGFASPVGMRVDDLFKTAAVRSEHGEDGVRNLNQALAPAIEGECVVRGLVFDYVAPEGTRRVLELTASPVLAEDASLMGTTVVLNDKTEIANIRQAQEMREELSAEMALALRSSLTTIAGYAQQLAHSRDPELGRQLADDIANEASQLDRTIGSFLAGSKAAAAAGAGS